MADEPDDVEMVLDRPKAPVELRTASVGEVNFAQRLATLIVTPYDQKANVMWEDQVWEESFERGAYDGIEKRPNRVKANRDHNKSRTVGKAVKFFPSRPEGLIAEVRVAQTPLGDETLSLLDEGCLGVSAGFAALPSDQIIDRRSRSRRIRRAFLDHISFVEDPAYTGAGVISIRENEILVPHDDDMGVITPLMDEFLNDPAFMDLLNTSKS